jgi:hypothetical protein
MRVTVRAQTIRDESYQGLIERIAGISELLINGGDKIVAVMASPMPGREVDWTATIFSSFEQKL